MNNRMHILSVSYGNDSVALIQWAFESKIKDCYVIYCDTGWAHPNWNKRVEVGMKLAESYGFTTWIMQSIGFEALVKKKKGFPGQMFQFCSGELKGLPFLKFADFIDPNKKAVVVIGKRRAESNNRADTPKYIFKSKYHGMRTVYHPLYKHTDSERDKLIKTAGFKVLPHRSLECCPCINANRKDLICTPESQLDKVRNLEKHICNTMFRPYKHQGASGIDEVMEWAYGKRGGYCKKQIRIWDYKEIHKTTRKHIK